MNKIFGNAVNHFKPATTLYDAELVCTKANFKLTKYSGKARDKSEVVCALCGHPDLISIVAIKQGRKCSVCKGHGEGKCPLIDKEDIQRSIEMTFETPPNQEVADFVQRYSLSLEEIATLKEIAQEKIKQRREAEETHRMMAELKAMKKEHAVKEAERKQRRQEMAELKREIEINKQELEYHIKLCEVASRSDNEFFHDTIRHTVTGNASKIRRIS